MADTFPEIGISPSNPGAFGAFQTLGPTFDPGYALLVQTFEVRPQVQPAAPRALSDPRGIVPGMPAKTFSYEVFEQINEFLQIKPFQANLSDFTGGTGGIEVSFNQLLGEVPTTSISKNCVIAFEGHDVVDLPTVDLPPGKGIVCPTNVFFPIYAGSKFISKKDDDFALKSQLEYNQRSKGNGVRGMVANDDLPMDSIQNDKGLFNQNARQGFDSYRIDATSNVIDGSGEFVSYVAIDKPLFRDVITSRTNAIAQGIFIGTTFVATFVGPIGTASVYVIRYAMMDMGTPGSPRFRWKMTESFGIDPKNKVDPPGSLFNASNANAINAAVLGKHYTYNVNDPGDEVAKDFATETPLKTGYNPSHALAMMDPASPFYRPGFRTQVQALKDGSDFFQSRLSVKSIWPSYTNINAPIKSSDGLYPTDSYQPYMNLDGLTSWRTYESPIAAGEFNNLRLGFEYAMRRTNPSGAISAVQTRNAAILLSKTQEALSGIGAFYDPSLQAIVAIGAESGTATERRVTDFGWGKKTDFGDTKAFLAGEASPLKTGGGTCLHTLKSDEIKDVAVNKSISVPGGYSAFELTLSPPSSIDDTKPPLIAILGSAGGRAFEAGLAFKPSSDIPVPIPPLAMSKVDDSKASGMSIKSVKCGKNASFLPSLENVKPDKADKDIVAQLNLIKDQDAPIPCNSVTATGIGSVTLFAYSSTNSIDIGYRATAAQGFLVVRDVVRRMGPSGSKTRPPASMPFLLPGVTPKTAILLYSYKTRILSKPIPCSVFQPLTGFENGRLDADAEAAISASLQAAGAVVAYDGHMKSRLDDIKEDVDAGFLLLDTTDSPLDGDAQDPPNVSSFSGCHGNGYSAMFLHDSGRVKGRLSGDSGKTWRDLFLPDTRIVPLKNKTSKPSEDPDGLYPFCYVDRPTGKGMFFIFADSALLSFSFHESLLSADRAYIKDKLDAIDIRVVYGELSENLESRGIALSDAVKDRQAKRKAANDTKTKETMTPQRIAVSRNAFGLHRLFYYDDKQFIKSLVSLDHGSSWLTEDQFQGTK